MLQCNNLNIINFILKINYIKRTQEHQNYVGDYLKDSSKKIMLIN